MSGGALVEEYLNLYHQKLWEIAFSNVEKVFGVFFVILLVLSILPIYIFFNSLVRRKKLILVLICIPFLMFILCIAAEYAYSYDKIMNPDSPYNDSLMVASLRHETVLPILEHVDEIPLDSVDGKLKRDDILVFALSNPTYYDALFADIANSLAGEQTIGKAFLVALVGYEEKNGEWQSVDIRIAPGKEEKDFQKFSKTLHIKKAKESSFNGIVSYLQELHEKKLESKKNR